jgi:hypothetical protein
MLIGSKNIRKRLFAALHFVILPFINAKIDYFYCEE